MDFEKKFFELLGSNKARKVIRDVLNEEDIETTQESGRDNHFGDLKNSDSNKKVIELKEKINVLEEEKQRLCTDIIKKEFDLSNLQMEIRTVLQNKEKIETELAEEKTAHNITLCELSSLKSEFDEMRKRFCIVNSDYERLRKSFDKPIECYERYSKLSDSTKNGLSNVISCKNVSLFIATCSNTDNLKKMWDYTKEILSDNKKQEDVEVLKMVFEYFFGLYNQSLVEPIYERDKTDVGDDYDDEYHTRSRESATSGRISKVLLRGYSSINTGRIVCKSVVQV